MARGLNDNLQAGCNSNKAESVGELLRAVRNEEAKVHIDLSTALKVGLVRMRGEPSSVPSCVFVRGYPWMTSQFIRNVARWLTPWTNWLLWLRLQREKG